MLRPHRNVSPPARVVPRKCIPIVTHSGYLKTTSNYLNTISNLEPLSRTGHLKLFKEEPKNSRIKALKDGRMAVLKVFGV